jgi:hypothetical protein
MNNTVPFSNVFSTIVPASLKISFPLPDRTKLIEGPIIGCIAAAVFWGTRIICNSNSSDSEE